MKVTYKIKDELLGMATNYQGVRYVYADGLSQAKLKKLFKIGVKGIYAEATEETKAEKPEE